MNSIKKLNSLQISLLIFLGVIAFACMLTSVIFVGIKAYPFISTESPVFAPTPQLPPFVINDVEDWGKGVDYFLVVDKSFSQADAQKVIAYYLDKHKNYYWMNIYFFCDLTNANQKSIEDNSLLDTVFYSHVLYWFQASPNGVNTTITGSTTTFITKPDKDRPTFGNACR